MIRSLLESAAVRVDRPAIEAKVNVRAPNVFVMPAKAGTQGQRSGRRPGFPLARE
jgi:hypothetical protein